VIISLIPNGRASPINVFCKPPPCTGVAACSSSSSSCSCCGTGISERLSALRALAPLVLQLDHAGNVQHRGLGAASTLQVDSTPLAFFSLEEFVQTDHAVACESMQSHRGLLAALTHFMQVLHALFSLTLRLEPSCSLVFDTL
jgi:hypothetical protein